MLSTIEIDIWRTKPIKQSIGHDVLTQRKFHTQTPHKASADRLCIALLYVVINKTFTTSYCSSETAYYTFHKTHILHNTCHVCQ